MKAYKIKAKFKSGCKIIVHKRPYINYYGSIIDRHHGFKLEIQYSKHLKEISMLKSKDQGNRRHVI